MVITHHGGQFFKVTFGNTTIAFDPVSKDSKNFSSSKFAADAVFISMRHPNFSGSDQIISSSKQTFVVDSPGEYEIGEVNARGFGVLTTYDKEPRWNTIYQVQLEGINMVFLGALSSPEIDSKILSEFGDIDILFLPIGGGEVLEVPQASKLAVKLEAKCVIPMHYDKKALDAFLKEEGSEAKPQDKLTIKKKEVSVMEGEVVILKS